MHSYANIRVYILHIQDVFFSAVYRTCRQDKSATSCESSTATQTHTKETNTQTLTDQEKTGDFVAQWSLANIYWHPLTSHIECVFECIEVWGFHIDIFKILPFYRLADCDLSFTSNVWYSEVLLYYISCLRFRCSSIERAWFIFKLGIELHKDYIL